MFDETCDAVELQHQVGHSTAVRSIPGYPSHSPKRRIRRVPLAPALIDAQTAWRHESPRTSILLRPRYPACAVILVPPVRLNRGLDVCHQFGGDPCEYGRWDI